jgi:hypothetical protein
VKSELEIREVIDDILSGIADDEDNYDSGYNMGFVNALNWVLREGKEW